MCTCMCIYMSSCTLTCYTMQPGRVHIFTTTFRMPVVRCNVKGLKVYGVRGATGTRGERELRGCSRVGECLDGRGG